jgi:hypothetical protein
VLTGWHPRLVMPTSAPVILVLTPDTFKNSGYVTIICRYAFRVEGLKA